MSRREMTARLGLKLSILCTALAVLAGVACRGPVRAVSVPEVDDQPELPLHVGRIQDGRLGSLEPGATGADVVRLLGEPARKFHSGAWAYAVRAFSRRGRVPAPVLRIEFDVAGVVSDWYFVHPLTDARLAIRETLPDAHNFLTRFCHAGRQPEIDLATAIRRGRTTTAEVARTLTFPGDGWTCCVPFRKTSTVSGERWDYHVDRPSAAFIAPGYYVIEVDSTVTAVSYLAPFGGCM